MENLVVPEKDKIFPKPCTDFDQILELIGSEGKFQKILLYGVLCPMVTISPFLGMQVLFMWDTPEHYCHVPGWNSSEMSLESWKNLTLPWENGPDGLPRYSKCKMRDQLSGNVTTCQFGWIYDKTDYENTIPMEFNWVCERDNYVTDCYTWGSVGGAVGTIIFGVMADKFGRKLIFFMTCSTTFVFTTWSLWWPGNILVYKGFQFLGCLASSAIFTMPTMIIAEVSSNSYRSWIYSVTWMIWVLGNSILPGVAWLCRDWWILGVISGILGFLQLGFYPIVEESPRWLISKGGREGEAVKIILKIARINGMEVDGMEIERMVDELGKKIKEDAGADGNGGRVGVWSLFLKWRVALSTVMLIIAWAMNGILYYGLTLHTTKMAGNVFLNYFLLSVIELPGGWLAGKLAEKTGRRWTQAGFFLMCTLSALVCAVAVVFTGLEAVVIIGALGIKFGVTVTSLVVYLQSTEIFPTMLRSTGTGFISTISSFIGILGPYIVYSGTVHVSFPYALLCLCAFLGFISASCLPETLNQPLPETIEDANKLNKGHKFWSYLPQDLEKDSSSLTVIPMNKNKIEN